MKENSGLKRVALVTGANKGIGFETARQLGQQQITVLLASRDASRGEEAAGILRREGLDVRPIVLDVTSQQTIDAAVEEVAREFGKLDILVNNAGILIEWLEPTQCTMENLRKTFEVNFFGLFAVTQAFLPLLEKSAAGRIVNVSSALGSLATMENSHENKFFAYSSSKAAVNMLTVLFARELNGRSIKVNAAAPGYTATELTNFNGTQTVEEGTIASFRLATLPDDGPTGSFMDRKGVVPW